MTHSARPAMPDITDADTVLWRYLDLYKWLDMLQTSEVHLTRADQMASVRQPTVTLHPIAYRSEGRAALVSGRSESASVGD